MPDEKPQTEIAEHSESQLQSSPTVSPADSIMQAIGQMVLNPEIPIDRINLLLEEQRTFMGDARRAAYNVAMAQFQAEMPPIIATTPNSQTQSKYATLGSILRVATPIMARCGLSFSMVKTACEKANHVGFNWTNRHADGHVEGAYVEFPLDDKGMKGSVNKTPLHAEKSTGQYARRDVFSQVYNIAIASEDDDGNAGGGRVTETISADQYIELKELMEKADFSEEALLKHFKANAGVTIEEFPASMFDKAKIGLLRRAEAIEGKKGTDQ